MPVGPGALPVPPTPDTPNFRKISTPLATIREMPSHSLAPSTLANPPAPTNLSSTAVVVNGERGIDQARPESSGGIPSGLLANVWGSTNWGFLNRLERGEIPESRFMRQISIPAASQGVEPPETQTASVEGQLSIESPVATSHRKTISLDGSETSAVSTATPLPQYPMHYPTQLRMQDAQFRLLFPNVPREEVVVLVFKATWNPNDQQEFPGRIYVTAKEIYFYSNYCGMTMTTSISLEIIREVTAAKGRDWDVLFLHLQETTEDSAFTRIMIKTFLEPLKLLQRRLSFLAQLSTDKPTASTDEIMRTLINLEKNDESEQSPDENDWENVSINTPIDGTSSALRSSPRKDHRDLRAKLLVDQGLYGSPIDQHEIKQSKSFKLPKQPVIFVPKMMDRLVVEKDFDISPKALYHVMFGDRSAVWQLLYHERQAQRKIDFGPGINSFTCLHIRRNSARAMDPI